MKETYYKLNREKGKKMSDDYVYETFNTLCELGILEEVQEEEEMTLEEQEEYLSKIATTNDSSKGKSPIMTATEMKTTEPCACGCTQEYPHSHLVFGKTCECEKGVKEAKEAIDNMFGNPLEQLANLADSVKEEDYKTMWRQAAEDDIIKYGKIKVESPKPFLDGISPIDWTKKFMEYNKSSIDEELSLNGRYIAALLTLLDLLVEELKKNNVIK